MHKKTADDDLSQSDFIFDVHEYASSRKDIFTVKMFGQGFLNFNFIFIVRKWLLTQIPFIDIYLSK